MSSSLTENLGD